MSETIKIIPIANTKENVLYFLNNPYSKETTGTRIGDLEKKVEDFICTKYVPRTWKEVQDIVRSGEAQKIFQIGDQFVVNKTVGDKTEELVFDIIGFDHDIPTDTNYKHSMTLQLHNGYCAMPFDSKEATWFIDPTTYPSGLAVGTYQFKYNMKNYIFTTTKVVPAGGQLQFNFSTSNGTITTYGSIASYNEIEICNISEGTSDNILPEVKIGSQDGTIANELQRSRIGSNNYFNSIVRQYINASTENNWWTAISNFSRPPIAADGTNYNEKPGFLCGIEPEFLNVIGDVSKVTALCNIDNANLVQSNERFFLLSNAEVYGISLSDSAADGKPYAFYSKKSSLKEAGIGADTNRIKMTSDGSTCIWSLRSVNSTSTYMCRIISKTGSVSRSASNNYKTAYICPACVII